jgi:hypothetical protein
MFVYWISNFIMLNKESYGDVNGGTKPQIYGAGYM